MLMGAVVGAVTAFILWIIFAMGAKKTTTVDALGPNPIIRESMMVALTPEQVLERLKAANNPTYEIEAASTPNAILIRRKTDSMTFGYAILIRTTVDPTGTTLNLSVAPLMKRQKQVMPKHWDHFRQFLDNSLR